MAPTVRHQLPGTVLEQFAGIHQVRRIQGALHCTHEIHFHFALVASRFFALYHTQAVLGAHAATQLMHNEHEVPEVPREILIPPAWIEGASIRPCKPGDAA